MSYFWVFFGIWVFVGIVCGILFGKIFNEKRKVLILIKWILSAFMAVLVVGTFEGKESLVIHVILVNIVFFFLPPHPIPPYLTKKIT